MNCWLVLSRRWCCFLLLQNILALYICIILDLNGNGGNTSNVPVYKATVFEGVQYLVIFYSKKLSAVVIFVIKTWGKHLN